MSCLRCGKPHNAGTKLTYELTADGEALVYFRVCRSVRRCDERLELARAASGGRPGEGTPP